MHRSVSKQCELTVERERNISKADVIIGVFWKHSRLTGGESKRRQTGTATSILNEPKRRQAETATNRNGDKP